jgi:co-chaperonin GroES (HSP10)|tara:strand:- start:2093 stop:2353 length:261 start_codon:yes stop_codon:yes gene_type:complete
MKAVGRNLVIKKVKEGTTKTKGGLLLAENQKEDIRYIEANVVSVGTEVNGIKKDDTIFFDRHAGHKIEVNKNTYHVIKAQDVVIVL